MFTNYCINLKEHILESISTIKEVIWGIFELLKNEGVEDISGKTTEDIHDVITSYINSVNDNIGNPDTTWYFVDTYTMSPDGVYGPKVRTSHISQPNTYVDLDSGNPPDGFIYDTDHEGYRSKGYVESGTNNYFNIYLKRKTYTVSYNGGDGYISTSSGNKHTWEETYYYEQTISPQSPHREGYTHTGWSPSLPEKMPMNNLSTSATYSINSHTVKWIIQGEVFSDTYHYGDTIVAHEDPSIEGYTFNGWSGSIPQTMPDRDLEFTANITINSYTLTIKFLDKSGNQIKPQSVYTYDYNKSYNYTPEIITGYTAESNAVSGNMPSRNIVYEMIYSINSHILTINYKYSDGSVASDSVIQRLNYNTQYTYNTPHIRGYSESQSVVSGNMPDEDVTVNVIYTIGTYTVTIHYVYDIPGFDAYDEEVTNIHGYSFEKTTPDVSGFTPDTYVVSKTIDENEEITVTYKANSYNINVEYINSEDGSRIYNDVHVVQKYNSQYSITSPTIEGYTPDISVCTGTLSYQDVNITVTYTIDTYTLTIVYMDYDNTEISRYTGQYKYSEVYYVETPQIEGRWIDFGMDVVSGNMTKADEYIKTVSYSREYHNIYITHINESGNKVADNQTVQAYYGETKILNSHNDILTYTPKETSKTVVMESDDLHIVFEYTLKEFNLNIVCNFVNSRYTSLLSKTLTYKVKYGSTYDFEAPENPFESITYGITPTYKNIKGVMPARDLNIHNYYFKNDMCASYKVNTYYMNENLDYEYAETKEFLGPKYVDDVRYEYVVVDYKKLEPETTLGNMYVYHNYGDSQDHYGIYVNSDGTTEINIYIDRCEFIVPSNNVSTVIDRSNGIVYGMVDKNPSDPFNTSINNLSNYLSTNIGNVNIERVVEGRYGTGTKLTAIVPHTDPHSSEVIYRDCETLHIVIFGDLNGDGMINSSDTSILNRYISEFPDYTYESIFATNIAMAFAADVNHNKIINEEDAYNIRNHIARVSPINQSIDNI